MEFNFCLMGINCLQNRTRLPIPNTTPFHIVLMFVIFLLISYHKMCAKMKILAQNFSFCNNFAMKNLQKSMKNNHPKERGCGGKEGAPISRQDNRRPIFRRRYPWNVMTHKRESKRNFILPFVIYLISIFI